MVHFLDITGAILYLAFRIIVLPVLVVVFGLFLVLTCIKLIYKLSKQVAAIQLKPIGSLSRVIRWRLHFSKS